MLEPPERLTVKYAVAVALKFRSQSVGFYELASALCLRRTAGVLAQIFIFDLYRYVAVTSFNFYNNAPFNLQHVSISEFRFGNPLDFRAQ